MESLRLAQAHRDTARRLFYARDESPRLTEIAAAVPKLQARTEELAREAARIGEHLAVARIVDAAELATAVEHQAQRVREARSQIEAVAGDSARLMSRYPGMEAEVARAETSARQLAEQVDAARIRAASREELEDVPGAVKALDDAARTAEHHRKAMLAVSEAFDLGDTVATLREVAGRYQALLDAVKDARGLADTLTMRAALLGDQAGPAAMSDPDSEAARNVAAAAELAVEAKRAASQLAALLHSHLRTEIAQARVYGDRANAKAWEYRQRSSSGEGVADYGPLLRQASRLTIWAKNAHGAADQAERQLAGLRLADGSQPIAALDAELESRARELDAEIAGNAGRAARLAEQAAERQAHLGRLLDALGQEGRTELTRLQDQIDAGVAQAAERDAAGDSARAEELRAAVADDRRRLEQAEREVKQRFEAEFAEMGEVAASIAEVNAKEAELRRRNAPLAAEVDLLRTHAAITWIVLPGQVAESVDTYNARLAELTGQLDRDEAGAGERLETYRQVASTAAAHESAFVQLEQDVSAARAEAATFTRAGRLDEAAEALDRAEELASRHASAVDQAFTVFEVDRLFFDLREAAGRFEATLARAERIRIVTAWLAQHAEMLRASAAAGRRDDEARQLAPQAARAEALTRAAVEAEFRVAALVSEQLDTEIDEAERYAEAADVLADRYREQADAVPVELRDPATSPLYKVDLLVIWVRQALDAAAAATRQREALGHRLDYLRDLHEMREQLDQGTDLDEPVTATEVPGSAFRGDGRELADRPAVLAQARRVLADLGRGAAVPGVGPAAQIAPLIRTAAGGRVQFTVTPAGGRPFVVQVDSGPLDDGVVATTRDARLEPVVTLSDRAADQVVERALAHEIAETLALRDGRQDDQDVLGAGAVDGPLAAADLSAHDLGRLAELSVVAAHRDAGEMLALARHLGLVEGTPGAGRRRAAVEELAPGLVAAMDTLAAVAVEAAGARDAVTRALDLGGRAQQRSEEADRTRRRADWVRAQAGSLGPQLTDLQVGLGAVELAQWSLDPGTTTSNEVRAAIQAAGAQFAAVDGRLAEYGQEVARLRGEVDDATDRAEELIAEADALRAAGSGDRSLADELDFRARMFADDAQRAQEQLDWVALAGQRFAGSLDEVRARLDDAQRAANADDDSTAAIAAAVAAVAAFTDEVSGPGSRYDERVGEIVEQTNDLRDFADWLHRSASDLLDEAGAAATASRGAVSRADLDGQIRLWEDQALALDAEVVRGQAQVERLAARLDEANQEYGVAAESQSFFSEVDELTDPREELQASIRELEAHNDELAQQAAMLRERVALTRITTSRDLGAALYRYSAQARELTGSIEAVTRGAIPRSAEYARVRQQVLDNERYTAELAEEISQARLRAQGAEAVGDLDGAVQAYDEVERKSGLLRQVRSDAYEALALGDTVSALRQASTTYQTLSTSAAELLVFAETLAANAQSMRDPGVPPHPESDVARQIVRADELVRAARLAQAQIAADLRAHLQSEIADARWYASQAEAMEARYRRYAEVLPDDAPDLTLRPNAKASALKNWARQATAAAAEAGRQLDALDAVAAELPGAEAAAAWEGQARERVAEISRNHLEAVRLAEERAEQSARRDRLVAGLAGTPAVEVPGLKTRIDTAVARAERAERTGDRAGAVRFRVEVRDAVERFDQIMDGLARRLVDDLAEMDEVDDRIRELDRTAADLDSRTRQLDAENALYREQGAVARTTVADELAVPTRRYAATAEELSGQLDLIAAQGEELLNEHRLAASMADARMFTLTQMEGELRTARRQAAELADAGKPTMAQMAENRAAQAARRLDAVLESAFEVFGVDRLFVDLRETVRRGMAVVDEAHRLRILTGTLLDHVGALREAALYSGRDDEATRLAAQVDGAEQLAATAMAAEARAAELVSQHLGAEIAQAQQYAARAERLAERYREQAEAVPEGERDPATSPLRKAEVLESWARQATATAEAAQQQLDPLSDQLQDLRDLQQAREEASRALRELDDLLSGGPYRSDSDQDDDQDSDQGSDGGRRITALAVPGSEFHGHGNLGHQGAARRAVTQVFDQLASRMADHLAASSVQLEADGGQDGSDRPRQITVTRLTGDQDEVVTFGLQLDHLPKDVVAQTLVTTAADGTQERTIVLNWWASKHVVERALAHELAENLVILDGNDNTVDVLTQDRRGLVSYFELSPHDVGRVAEMQVLLTQLDESNRISRPRIQAEIWMLGIHLGLIAGTPGAADRRAFDPDLIERMDNALGWSRVDAALDRLGRQLLDEAPLPEQAAADDPAADGRSRSELELRATERALEQNYAWYAGDLLARRNAVSEPLRAALAEATESFSDFAGRQELARNEAKFHEVAAAASQSAAEQKREQARSLRAEAGDDQPRRKQAKRDGFWADRGLEWTPELAWDLVLELESAATADEAAATEHREQAAEARERAIDLGPELDDHRREKERLEGTLENLYEHDLGGWLQANQTDDGVALVPDDGSRPYGMPYGFVRPPMAAQQYLELQLERARARNADGSFQAFAEPRGPWLDAIAVNQWDAHRTGAPTQGRSLVEDIDAFRSLRSTWSLGQPRVAAERTLNGFEGRHDTPEALAAVVEGLQEDMGGPLSPVTADLGEKSFAGRRRGVLRGFENAYESVLAGGHGALAGLVLSHVDGRRSMLAVMNHHGTLHVVDLSTGAHHVVPADFSSDSLLYPAELYTQIEGVAANGAGEPLRLTGRLAGRRASGAVQTEVRETNQAAQDTLDVGMAQLEDLVRQSGEPGSPITALDSPGSPYRGLWRTVPSPVAVLDQARAVVEGVGQDAGVQVTLGRDGRLTLAGHDRPIALVSGPLPDGVIVQTAVDETGIPTSVTVSDRAPDDLVEEAMAHEIAEILSILDGNDNLTDLLHVGSRGPFDAADLSAHDHGLIAQLANLARRYENTVIQPYDSPAGAPLQRLVDRALRREPAADRARNLAAEVAAVRDFAGLRPGLPGAAVRRATLDPALVAAIDRIANESLIDGLADVNSEAVRAAAILRDQAAVDEIEAEVNRREAAVRDLVKQAKRSLDQAERSDLQARRLRSRAQEARQYAEELAEQAAEPRQRAAALAPRSSRARELLDQANELDGRAAIVANKAAAAERVAHDAALDMVQARLDARQATRAASQLQTRNRRLMAYAVTLRESFAQLRRESRGEVGTLAHQAERTGPAGRAADWETPGGSRLFSAIDHVNPYAVDAATEQERYLDMLTEAEHEALVRHLADAQGFADDTLGRYEQSVDDRNRRAPDGDAIQIVTPEARVKRLASLARGFINEQQASGATLEEFLHQTYDIVRFKLQIPHNQEYGAIVRGLLDAETSPPNNHTLVRLKSFWRPGNRHYGLNAYFRTPEGHLFEVQFPTDRAGAINSPTQALYQVLRLPTVPGPVRVDAFLQCLTLSSQAGMKELPGGLDLLPDQVSIRDHSLARFIVENPAAWVQYLLALPDGRTFADDLSARGLDASDVPGVDVETYSQADYVARLAAMDTDAATAALTAELADEGSGVDAVRGEQTDVQLSRDLRDGGDDVAGARPDRARTDEPVQSGDLEPPRRDVDVLAGDGGAVPPGGRVRGPDDGSGPVQGGGDRPGAGNFTSERSRAASDLRVDPYAVEPGSDPWASAQRALEWAAGRESHARARTADAAAARRGAERAAAERSRIVAELERLAANFETGPFENRLPLQHLIRDLTGQRREWSREGERLASKATKATIDAEQSRRQAANVSGRAQTALDRLAAEFAATPDGQARLERERARQRGAAGARAGLLRDEAAAARLAADRETAEAGRLMERADAIWAQLTGLTSTNRDLSPSAERAPADVHALVLQAFAHEREAARLAALADANLAAATALEVVPPPGLGQRGAGAPPGPFDQDAPERPQVDAATWARYEEESAAYFADIAAREQDLQAWFDEVDRVEREVARRHAARSRMLDQLQQAHLDANRAGARLDDSRAARERAADAARTFAEAAAHAYDVARANRQLAEALTRAAGDSAASLDSLTRAEAYREASVGHRLDAQAVRARQAAEIAYTQALDLEARATQQTDKLAELTAEAERAGDLTRHAEDRVEALEAAAAAYLAETETLDERRQALAATDRGVRDNLLLENPKRWMFQNRDVGRLVEPGDPAVDGSQIPGKQNRPAVESNFHKGTGFRPVLLAHLRLLEQAVRDVSRGGIPRRPDPSQGSWFQRVNAFGYALDAGRRRNCIEARAAFVRTYLHGQPTVAGPAARSAFVGRHADRLAHGEFPHRDEAETGGRWQSVVPDLTGTPLAEAATRVEQGYEALQRLLDSAPDGTVVMVNTYWHDNEAHGWAAVRHGGRTLWLDPQTGVVKESGDEVHPAATIRQLDVIVLNADADPVPVAGLPISANSVLAVTPAYERAASTASDQAPAERGPGPVGLGAVPAGDGTRSGRPVPEPEVPGSKAHGHGRATAEPANVLAHARQILPNAAADAGLNVRSDHTDGRPDVRHPDGTPVPVLLTSGPLPSYTLAETRYGPDGTALVVLSNRLSEVWIERALARQLGEIRERADIARRRSILQRAVYTVRDAVGRGTGTPPEVTWAGRVAELRHLVRVAGEGWRPGTVAAEVEALFDHLGLQRGLTGAAGKRAMLGPELTSEIDRLLTTARLDRVTASAAFAPAADAARESQAADPAVRERDAGVADALRVLAGDADQTAELLAYRRGVIHREMAAQEKRQAQLRTWIASTEESLRAIWDADQSDLSDREKNLLARREENEQRWLGNHEAALREATRELARLRGAERALTDQLTLNDEAAQRLARWATQVPGDPAARVDTLEAEIDQLVERVQDLIVRGDEAARELALLNEALPDLREEVRTFEEGEPSPDRGRPWIELQEHLARIERLEAQIGQFRQSEAALTSRVQVRAEYAQELRGWADLKAGRTSGLPAEAQELWKRLTRPDGPGPEPGTAFSGGTWGPRDSEAAFRWAEEAYNRFRADDLDVDDIAAHLADTDRADGSRGFTRAEVAEVKDHLMRVAHRLENFEGTEVEYRRLDPNLDIAEAWIRLREGRALPEDLTLLEHELVESRYLRDHPGAPYLEADAHANETHNWAANVPPRRGEDLDVSWRRADGADRVLPSDRGERDAGRVRVRTDQGAAGPPTDGGQGDQGRPADGPAGGRPVPGRGDTDRATAGPRGDLAGEGPDAGLAPGPAADRRLAAATELDAELVRREALAQRLEDEAAKARARLGYLGPAVDNAELTMTTRQEVESTQALYEREAAALRRVEQLVSDGEFADAVRVYGELQDSHTDDAE